MLYIFDTNILYPRLDSKGEISSYFGTEKTNIVKIVSVVACISKVKTQLWCLIQCHSQS
jgi:hypothetical protein